MTPVNDCKKIRYTHLNTWV